MVLIKLMFRILILKRDNFRILNTILKRQQHIKEVENANRIKNINKSQKNSLMPGAGY